MVMYRELREFKALYVLQDRKAWIMARVKMGGVVR